MWVYVLFDNYIKDIKPIFWSAVLFMSNSSKPNGKTWRIPFLLLNPLNWLPKIYYQFYFLFHGKVCHPTCWYPSHFNRHCHIYFDVLYEKHSCNGLYLHFYSTLNQYYYLSLTNLFIKYSIETASILLVIFSFVSFSSCVFWVKVLSLSIWTLLWNPRFVQHPWLWFFSLD